VRLAAGTDGPHRISVSDTGPGIPEADLDRIFLAFQRSAHDGRRVEGTGLGLHISRRLAELLGAGIAVETAIGEGSTFTVTHPD
jgi:protein-histidine pros-kinase